METLDTISAKISRKVKAQLHQVADLVLEIYITLAKMRRIELEWIQRGPHDINHKIPEYRELGIGAPIIYLYSILPYLDPKIHSDEKYFLCDSFCDFRDHVERRPFERDWHNLEENEDEPRRDMESWMTPLAASQYDGLTMIYSAKRHMIWIFATEDPGSSMDPALNNGGLAQFDANLMDDEVEGLPKHDDGGSIKNDYGIFERWTGRDAISVLTDIVRWYRNLALCPIPGYGGEDLEDWELDGIRAMYRRHGWTSSNFDDTGFLVEWIRTCAVSTINNRAEYLRTHVKMWSIFVPESDIKWEKLQDNITKAATPQEQWVARWRLVQQQRQNKLAEIEVVQDEKDRERIPLPKTGDMPLWEQEWLKTRLNTLRQKRDKAVAQNGSLDIPTDGDWITAVQGYHADNTIPVYELALQHVQVDVEEKCPGRTFQQLGAWLDMCAPAEMALERCEARIACFQQTISDFKTFMGDMPSSLEKTMREIVRDLYIAKDHLAEEKQIASSISESIRSNAK